MQLCTFRPAKKDHRHRIGGVGRVRAAGHRVDHGFAIAVVGNDKHRATHFFERGNDRTKSAIHGFAGLDCGLQIAGMADHVRVGVIGNDKIVTLADRLDEFLRHLGRAHLRLQVVGRNLRRFRHEAVFADFRLFLAAIQEEGDMRIFFRLGEAKLREPLFCHPGAERIDDIALGVGRRHEMAVAGGIFDHTEQRRKHGLFARKTVEIIGTNGKQDFTRTVGAEIQAEQAVASLETFITIDHRWQDEFVGDIVFVALGNGAHRIPRVFAFRQNHGVIGFLDALPAIVAIHRIITADYRADAGTLRQARYQRRHKIFSRLRRDVAAIGDGMHHDLQAVADHQPHRRLAVEDMAMDAAIGNHAHQMRHTARGFYLGCEIKHRRIAEKAAILDRQIDLAEIHGDDAARADIGVAHFRIAHLPGGQADIRAEGGQRRIRAGGKKPVHGRRVRQNRRIAGCILTQPPAIENSQDNGSGSLHGRTFFVRLPAEGGPPGTGAPSSATMIMMRKHASRSSLLYPKMTNASLYRHRNSSVKVENASSKMQS
ncbi:hypothetical protein D3C86_1238450 [compost metagenome]